MNGSATAPARRPSTYHPIGPRCPKHPGETLTGGPVQYHCASGDGHRVQAADLSREATR